MQSPKELTYNQAKALSRLISSLGIPDTTSRIVNLQNGYYSVEVDVFRKVRGATTYIGWDKICLGAVRYYPYPNILGDAVSALPE